MDLENANLIHFLLVGLLTRDHITNYYKFIHVVLRTETQGAAAAGQRTQTLVIKTWADLDQNSWREREIQIAKDKAKGQWMS